MYKLKFIDSFRFMQTSLSNFVDNLFGIYSKECKGCKSVCNFIGFKNNELNYKCKECNKRLSKSINGLIKKFPIIYQFCKGDINKFVLLLRKGVYPCEHMDSWERFNETSLLDKKAFYSKLYSEDITDEDYTHYQKVFKKFGLKNLGDYHDLYAQCDTLLLTDVFENFRNNFIEIYELDLVHFLSVPGLAWQACLKKTVIRLELLTDIDSLLIAEKGTRGGICHAIHRYAKANDKLN